MSEKYEILLVEDNLGDVKLFTTLFASSLTDSHFTVAMDGEQALEYLHRRGQFTGHPIPNIIILDINLPRKSGKEVLVEIKSLPELVKVPILVLSGSNNPEDKNECLRLGATRCETKPATLPELRELINIIKGQLGSNPLKGA